MSAVLIVVFMLLILEFLENRWQKGLTIKDVILSNYEIYSFNMFLYFLRHPTLWFTLFIAIEIGVYNWIMFTIISMKFLDIATKLYFISKIDKLGKEYLNKIEFQQKSSNIKAIGTVLYPLALLFALAYA
jgi:hypothetical protein